MPLQQHTVCPFAVSSLDRMPSTAHRGILCCWGRLAWLGPCIALLMRLAAMLLLGGVTVALQVDALSELRTYGTTRGRVTAVGLCWLWFFGVCLDWTLGPAWVKCIRGVPCETAAVAMIIHTLSFMRPIVGVRGEISVFWSRWWGSDMGLRQERDWGTLPVPNSFALSREWVL